MALLAVNTVVVDSRTRPAEARDGGEIVETGIVPANVKVEGVGPPIVLIHGFGAALDWWDEIAPALAADHRVIRIDLIGHGGTEAPRSGYSIERQASLVASVLDKLGAGRVTVIGHSMGGEVATAFAEANPQRVERMVLIDSPPKPETTFKLGTRLALMPVLGELMSRFMTDATIREMLAQGFAPGFPVPDEFVADVKQLTYTAFRTAHDDSMAYETAKPVFERLAALNPPPPLLVIFGSRDQLISPSSAKLFEKVAGARVEIIDGPGHSPMVEAPAKTLELIKSFLGRS
ncbi:alpha/beta fold hydrolase [Methyloceanibacter sp.]|uniref:alpha/beta fold hydrolase n=1 Tax=Methyloceanibacter sp. TaxID=1965321 RepID=UPI003D6C705B